MTKSKSASLKKALLKQLYLAKDLICDKCGTVADSAGETYQTSQRMLAKKVKKHPIRSIGFAMAAAYILSKII